MLLFTSTSVWPSQVPIKGMILQSGFSSGVSIPRPEEFHLHIICAYFISIYQHVLSLFFNKDRLLTPRVVRFPKEGWSISDPSSRTALNTNSPKYQGTQRFKFTKISPEKTFFVACTVKCVLWFIIYLCPIHVIGSGRKKKIPIV